MSVIALYGSDVATATLATAAGCATTTGGTEVSTATLVGSAFGYGELYALGTSSAWSAAASIGAPSGHGWLWDVTTLEGHNILAGTWTQVVTLRPGSNSGLTFVADVIFRAYLYDALTLSYSSLGSITLAGQSFTSGAKNAFTLSSTAFATPAVTTGQKLYFDCWLNVTANTLASGASVYVYVSNSTAAGVGSDMQVTGSGYGSPMSPVIYNDNPYGVTVFNGGPGLSSSLPLTQLVSDMQTLGLSWLRVDVSWNKIESPQGTYTWTGLDQIVSACNSAHINVCFTIDNAPTWAKTTASQQATTEPFYLPDPTLTAGFATVVATRYNGAGGYGYIAAIEVGNETYNIHFTTPGSGYVGLHNSPYLEYNGIEPNNISNTVQPARDPYFLVPVLQAVAPAIRAASPQCLVGLAAIWWQQANNIGDFLTGIYAGGTAMGQYFDFINLHFYPAAADPLSATPSFPSEWQALATVCATYEDWNKRVWVTEFGWTTSTNFGRPSANVVTQAEQAQYYQELLDSARESTVVSHAFFYTLLYDSDGMSLVQGNSAPYTYVQAFTTLQTYIQTYPYWPWVIETDTLAPSEFASTGMTLSSPIDSVFLADASGGGLAPTIVDALLLADSWSLLPALVPLESTSCSEGTMAALLLATGESTALLDIGMESVLAVPLEPATTEDAYRTRTVFALLDAPLALQDDGGGGGVLLLADALSASEIPSLALLVLPGEVPVVVAESLTLEGSATLTSLLVGSDGAFTTLAIQLADALTTLEQGGVMPLALPPDILTPLDLVLLLSLPTTLEALAPQEATTQQETCILAPEGVVVAEQGQTGPTSTASDALVASDSTHEAFAVTPASESVSLQEATTSVLLLVSIDVATGGETQATSIIAMPVDDALVFIGQAQIAFTLLATERAAPLEVLLLLVALPTTSDLLVALETLASTEAYSTQDVLLPPLEQVSWEVVSVPSLALTASDLTLVTATSTTQESAPLTDATLPGAVLCAWSEVLLAGDALTTALGSSGGVPDTLLLTDGESLALIALLAVPEALLPQEGSAYALVAVPLDVLTLASDGTPPAPLTLSSITPIEGATAQEDALLALVSLPQDALVSAESLTLAWIICTRAIVTTRSGTLSLLVREGTT